MRQLLILVGLLALTGMAYAFKSMEKKSFTAAVTFSSAGVSVPISTETIRKK